MKIGISGASGQLGTTLLKELKDRKNDHQIVAISRTPEEITLADETRRGDYNDSQTLENVTCSRKVIPF